MVIAREPDVGIRSSDREETDDVLAEDLIHPGKKKPAKKGVREVKLRVFMRWMCHLRTSEKTEAKADNSSMTSRCRRGKSSSDWHWN